MDKSSPTLGHIQGRFKDSLLAPEQCPVEGFLEEIEEIATKTRTNMGPRSNQAIVPISIREDMLKDPFFSSTWKEFDESRDRMMEDSGHGNFWDKVEADMERFEAGIAAMEKDMESRMSGHRPSIPDWAVPEPHKQNWQPITKSDNGTVQGFRSQTIKDTGDSWTLEVDLGDYEPDGVKLSVKGDIVIIRAGKSNLTLVKNNQTSYCTSIERRFTLPSGCNPDQITSRLSNTNQLIVNCPRKLLLTGPSNKALRFP